MVASKFRFPAASTRRTHRVPGRAPRDAPRLQGWAQQNLPFGDHNTLPYGELNSEPTLPLSVVGTLPAPLLVLAAHASDLMLLRREVALRNLNNVQNVKVTHSGDNDTATPVFGFANLHTTNPSHSSL